MKKNSLKKVAAALALTLTLCGCQSQPSSSNTKADEIYEQMITYVEEGNFSEALKAYNFNKEDIKGYKDSEAIHAYAQARFQYDALINSESIENQMDAFTNELDTIADDYSGEFAEDIKNFKAELAEKLPEVQKAYDEANAAE